MLGMRSAGLHGVHIQSLELVTRLAGNSESKARGSASPRRRDTGSLLHGRSLAILNAGVSRRRVAGLQRG
jgi:hypothetical protein